MERPIQENMSKKTISLLSFGLLTLAMLINGLVRPNLGHSATDDIRSSFEQQLNEISQKYENRPALKTRFDQSLDEYQDTNTPNLEAIMYDLHIEREALKKDTSEFTKKAEKLDLISDAVLYTLLERSYRR